MQVTNSPQLMFTPSRSSHVDICCEKIIIHGVQTRTKLQPHAGQVSKSTQRVSLGPNMWEGREKGKSLGQQICKMVCVIIVIMTLLNQLIMLKSNELKIKYSYIIPCSPPWILTPNSFFCLAFVVKSSWLSLLLSSSHSDKVT